MEARFQLPLHVSTVRDRLDLSSSLAAADVDVWRHPILGSAETETPRPPGAVAFITEALQESGAAVLVHCQAGMSRSAALVIAYLQKSLSLSPRSLERFCGARPSVAPNPGFTRQLLVFDAMGCEVDTESEVYTAWEASLRTPEAVASKMQEDEERMMFAAQSPPAGGVEQKAAMERRLAAV